MGHQVKFGVMPQTTIDALCFRRFRAAAFVLGLLLMCANTSCRDPRSDRALILNRLRDEINANYGYMEGTPRINCGPCARFAIAFRERWNARFRERVNLACVMSPDRRESGHVLIKFSDGAYFDGGNGIMSEQQLRALYPHPIEEMVKFDRQRLDQLVGGLDRDHYPECPNYSQELTNTLIDKYLARL